MTRRIWSVPTSDVPCIVIAETAIDARQIVIDYLDGYGDEDDHGDPVDVTDPAGWRWVEHESATDRAHQTRELDKAGVDVPDAILWRETYRPGFSGGPRWWAVGARDKDWCRLPAGVLSGGAA